ncbi:MAG TPA: AAA family ATPase [Gaiellaceae bacterium]|nr:AAA family ATPase [Gaiellaceae bacterium]
MSTTIRTLVAVDSDVDARTVENAFPAGSAVHVAGVVEGLERGWSVLEETAPDLLVVACAGYSERVLYLIEAASKQRPERPVVVLYYGAPDGFLHRAFEMGADDLLTMPASPEDLEFALRKVMARRRGSLAGGTANPMVCIVGPKGGTGKTLAACNLAVALAKKGKRSIVVDLDLQFGDVGIAMGLSPDRTIYDLARVGGSLDPDKVEDFLMHHASGARALLAPSRPDQAGTVTVEFLRELYATLRTRHDFVIVDTPPGFTPEVIASIDLASDLLVVGMLDALSLKDTKLGLETLALMGVPAERIRLILNRADSSVGIKRSEAEAILGRKPDVFVPSDRQIPRATTDGQPIVVASERSEAARAFHSLADLYLQKELVAAAVNGNGNGKGSNGDGGSKRRRRPRRRSKQARS